MIKCIEQILFAFYLSILNYISIFQKKCIGFFNIKKKYTNQVHFMLKSHFV